jgi:hypothetical protein
MPQRMLFFLGKRLLDRLSQGAASVLAVARDFHRAASVLTILAAVFLAFGNGALASRMRAKAFFIVHKLLLGQLECNWKATSANRLSRRYLKKSGIAHVR